MESAMNKTTYELLSVSDSDSGIHQQIQELNYKSPRRKRLRKRLPSNRIKRYDNAQSPKCHSYGKLMSLSFIIIILCCWLLILSWLVVIFNDELRRFDSNIMAIVAGNQGIPESVRQCHSQTKELQKNQSDIYLRMNGLNTQLSNLSKQVSTISSELKQVQEKLNMPTELHDVPTNIKELSNNVTNWIRNLNETVAQLKQSEDDFQALKQNVTSLNEKLLSADKVPKIDISSDNRENSIYFQDVANLIRNLTTNITYLNETFSEELQLIRKDYLLDHSTFETFLYKNVTLRLNALEGEYAKLIPLMDNIQNLTNRVNLTQSEIINLNAELATLSNDFSNMKKKINRTDFLT